MSEIHNQAEIISIGTELLMGEIIDTNAKYLAGELRLIGIEIGRATTAGDDKAQLTRVFREALSRTDLILASGGLGPTDDDLTRDCLAEVLGETLEVDSGLEQELRDYFTRFGRRQMPSHNIRQAMLIPSARPLPNANGTAPGWWVEKNGKTIVLIPGPPREMEPMWRNEIRPRLINRNPGKVAMTRTIKVFGMGEATVNEAVAPFFHLDNPSLGIYAKPDGIHLRLISRGDNAACIIKDIDGQLRNILKEHVWGTDDETLPGIAAGLLLERRLTIAVFDGGTGGSLSTLLYGTDSFSQFYRGSIIKGNDKAETAPVIPPEIVSKYGAISAETAEAEAVVARNSFHSDIGLGITGITGLDGAAGETTGITFIGLVNGDSKTHWQQVIIPRREMARGQLAVAALFHLREYLLK